MISTQTLAGQLDAAIRAATAVPQLTMHRPLSLDDAYEVQRAGIGLRADRGDVAVGVKLGFTSKAKAEQMGVFDVIVGVLTQHMHIADGGTIDLSRLIHPRIEPEIAFRLSADVDPQDPLSDISAAVADIAPALEIIDSRYCDFSFTLADVVADNTSASGFVLGPWQPFAEEADRIDVGDLDVVLEVDGAVTAKGSTAAILGHPLRALDAAKRMARHRGLALPAGTVILAGAATASVALTAGATVQATVADLGQVAVRAVGGRHD